MRKADEVGVKEDGKGGIRHFAVGMLRLPNNNTSVSSYPYTSTTLSTPVPVPAASLIESVEGVDERSLSDLSILDHRLLQA